MTKSQLTAAIQNYNSSYSEEMNFKPSFLELLLEKDCFLRSRLEGHFTASCWVTDANIENVLLLHHKKLGKWLQPGGHTDGDENLIQVATKELEEETGLKDFRLHQTDIFDMDIHLIPKKKNIPEHYHYDIRFHFIANKPNEIQKNHESLSLKWVKIEGVSELCGDEKSIMRMVEKSYEL